MAKTKKKVPKNKGSKMTPMESLMKPEKKVAKKSKKGKK